MSFLVETDRLILKVEDESIAKKVLLFYEENKKYFEPYEATRPDNFYSIEYQTAAMQCEYTEAAKAHSLRYYIYPKSEPDTLIGTVNFANIRPHPFASTVIGYKLHHDYWGNGYITEACLAGINIMFSDYRMHRIEGKVAPDNTRSIHVLERLGFTYEGTEYKSVEVNGTFTDHRRYSLLNNDYHR
ncbi:MAG: GNAT family N-acetyltransferase [Lachnospiraceae bacterium]|nr:GNAT family N-acetyltransferase [Lachnospiraceae bacterium]